MIGQVDLYGVFIPTVAVLALSAYGVFRILGAALHSTAFYRWVWHRPLFNLALFLTIFGGLFHLMQWFQT